MKFIDLQNMYIKREKNPRKIDEQVAKEIIFDYLQITNRKSLNVKSNSYVEALMLEYLNVKGTKKEEILLNLFKQYKMNYQASVREGIYHLLSKVDERDEKINPRNWPGIISVERKKNKYILDTQIGKIEVYKATKIIKSPVLERPLSGYCYQRTYEYLKENPEYSAIISYLPNFFYGGMYHAYLKKDNCVFDIASNAYYKDMESANKVLNGEIVETLSLKEVRRRERILNRTIEKIPKDCGLLNVGLYYEIKNKR